jgi:uncharacterized membrane protein YqjE
MQYEKPILENRERSVGELLSELANEMARLLHHEVELAKTELSEKAGKAGRNAASLAVGGAIAYAALLAFLAALILLLANFMPWWTSALAVSVVFGIIGAVMVSKALERLKQLDPAPRQTLETLKEDVAWAKQQMK